MKLIFSLSLRNLLRQKRRNFFLGIAICFGMMILVMANSFSHGLSDTLLNKMMVFITGHMSIVMMEDSSKFKIVIRDKNRFIDIIKSNVKDVKNVYEAVGRWGRVIGNEKGENMIIVGSEVDKEFVEYLGQSMIEGNLADFSNPAIENPVIIYSDRAKSLRVKLKDTLNVRMRTINKQEQSARLTIVAILRSNNIFEGTAMFINLKNLKSLIGLKPHETGAIYINFNKIDNPSHAIGEADKLKNLLVPGVAVIHGEALYKKKSSDATVLGYTKEKKSRDLMEKNCSLISGAFPDDKSEDGALISKKLATDLGLKKADSFNYRYQNKYDNITSENNYRVSGIFHSGSFPDANIVLLNERTFYKTYLDNLPGDARKYKNAYIPNKKSVLYPAFAPEWKLLPRTATFEELQKKISTVVKSKWKGPWLDVRTMYESADFILKLEAALNLVALIAVLILFFIILIGVLNTLRMTIRERTREIGTVRAIGMQKSDVKYLFISETLFLTAIACLSGLLLAFLMMWTLSRFTINTDSVLSILLVNRRLYFLPTVFTITRDFILILIMAAVTAYFPAKRASNLSAVEALRHFE